MSQTYKPNPLTVMRKQLEEEKQNRIKLESFLLEISALPWWKFIFQKKKISEFLFYTAIIPENHK